MSMGCYGLMSVSETQSLGSCYINSSGYGRKPLRVATELDDSVMVRLEYLT